VQINTVYTSWYQHNVHAQIQVVAKAERHEGTRHLAVYLTQHTAKAAGAALDTWWNMLQTFIVQFNDGFNNTLKMEETGPKINVATVCGSRRVC
jgi:hypothetical protein